VPKGWLLWGADSKGAWHTIEVKEESTIFEAKDGVYKP